jgi:two-component system chemotaxis response regulator CheY
MIQCLVVDHDTAERRSVSGLLASYGFRLTEADNADGALRHCRTHTPDVIVVSDRIGMAEQDFIRRARQSGRHKRPVVLVYTGGNDTDRIGRAILDGAAECLVKPFDRELLEFKLKQVGLL